MQTYKLSMLSELAHQPVESTLEADSIEQAIAKAENISDSIPVLLCMTLTDESGNVIKTW